MQVSNNFMENVVFRDYNKEQEQSIHHSKVKHISDFVPDAVDILRNGEVHYGDTMPWTKTHDKFRFRSSEVTIWAGANGCLSGDTLIPVSRDKNGKCKAKKLSSLYYHFNNIKDKSLPEYPIYANEWDSSRKVYTKSCNEDTMFAVMNEITGVIYSGEKEVFVVESELGDEIKTTKDHRFLTDSGFKRLENISVGDVVYFQGKDKGEIVDSNQVGRNKNIPLFQINNVGQHPNARKRTINGLSYTSHPLHRLVVEADLNRMPLEKFLSLLHKDISTLSFLPNKSEVHHVDRDRTNNDISNLMVLTKAEHTKIHEDDLVNAREWNRIRKQKIASITSQGVERTYDIQMNAPHHNFIANNYVVHNSGKSLVMGQVAIHLSKSTPVGIASFEMQPKKTVLRMLVQALPTNPSDQAIEQFNQELDIHIYDHVGNLDEDTVYGMCRYMAKEKGIKHIMIDSLVKCGINQSENEPQKRFMSKIQDIAKEYDIHIHVVMHLKKSEKETDRPDKNSIKGAGELVDLTDNALLIWRNKVKENLTSKQKRGEILTEKEVKTIEQPDCFIRVAKQRHGDYEDTLGFWFFLERQQWIDNNRGVYDRYIY